MREPDPALEEQRLLIPALSCIPLVVALVWSFFSGTTNTVVLFGVFFVWLSGNLYSQVATGWAHDGRFKATWMRGSDYDAIYWLNVVVTLLGALLTGYGFFASLLGP